ncbi:MAG: DNA translocase FtsK [Candidatus Omnitrophota bacterium]|nr:DNA translocase FtsK [Candidatus Omnitrophota bacterium]
MTEDRINEIIGLLLIAVSILIGLSLISYHPADTDLVVSSVNSQTNNFTGIVGAYLAQILFFLAGKGAYLIPFLAVIWGIFRLKGKKMEHFYLKLVGAVILLVSVSSIWGLQGTNIQKMANGGVIGFRFSGLSTTYFGIIGSYVILVTLFILSVLLTTELLFFSYLLRLVKGAISRVIRLRKVRPAKLRFNEQKLSRSQVKYAAQIRSPQIKPAQLKPERVKLSQPRTRVEINPEIKPVTKPVIPKPEPVPVRNVVLNGKDKYNLPSLDLLESPPPVKARRLIDDLNANARVLEETLRDFGIEVKVTEINRGPVITRYEVLPAPGVKVNRIVALSDDLALTLKAASIHIVAPIPGKSAVGIEVPNSSMTLVYLKEVLQSSEWQNSSSTLRLSLGKDVAGNPIVTGLTDMPHLLIAGATGSGKTLCINNLIIGLLFRLTPEELKFLMIDPKRVELAAFNDIPHLLCPVVTDPDKVIGALNWMVDEMESRYKIFAGLGVRNIGSYNKKLAAGELKSTETGPLKHLPYLVIIIDELADLMVVASDKIENAITRLAQLSRAVGIHIVLATQRPSVDVITGVIKANFPARISFKVASKVDSRTVLDANGADKLLGKGDLLFLKPGSFKPIRGQGTLILDKEIERVVKFIKSQSGSQYNEEVLAQQQKKSSQAYFEEDDLFDEAVKMVLATGQASVSMLQRRMRLGYTRAARMVDTMEEKGIVGPYRGSRPREILVEDYKEKTAS